MPFYVYIAKAFSGERDSLFSVTQYQIAMKRFFSLIFSLLCVSSLLFAAEWVWDTKGFEFQRIRLGEEGEWMEIPSYVESYLSHNASPDTKLYIQWADIEDGWLEGLTFTVESNKDIPIVSASEYVEIRKQEDHKEQKEVRKFGSFEKSIGFSAGYGSKLIGILSNNSSLSSPTNGFPRISLPDAVTLEISGEASFTVKRWGISAECGIRSMTEPSPIHSSMFDSWDDGYLFSLNPYAGLGASYHWDRVELKGSGTIGVSVLSAAFADNAHTGNVLDIGIGKYSTSYTINGTIEVGLRVSESVSFTLNEKLICYYPSMYMHLETLLGIKTNI